jgi:hypothetical protein
MEYFWKENKKFVIAVGAGLLVMILYNALVLGPVGSSADRAKRNLLKEKAELKALMANGVPSDDSIRAAKQSRDRLKQTLGTLAADTVFKAPDRYKKPDRESAKSHFESLSIDVAKELRDKATSAKLAFPSLIDFGGQVTDEVAGEYLLRLAIVERLAQVAIESEVDKIEVIDPLAGQARDEVAAKKGNYLTKYGVYMKFSGRAEAVFKVLHGVQKKGQYLAVSGFEAVRDDSTKDQFVATLSVAALKVDEKGTLDVKGSP